MCCNCTVPELNKYTHIPSDWTPSKHACFLSSPVWEALRSPCGAWVDDELDLSSCTSSLKMLHLRCSLPSEQSTLCCCWVLLPGVACFALRQRMPHPCWWEMFFQGSYPTPELRLLFAEHKNQAPIFPDLPGTEVPYVRSTLAVSQSIPVWLAGTRCFSPGCRTRMERTRCSGDLGALWHWNSHPMSHGGSGSRAGVLALKRPGCQNSALAQC